MYAVFECTLLSDKGKSLVREHTGDYDAQTVYSKLCDYALLSTKTTINSSNILTYITSSRLGDGTWKSDTHAYLLPKLNHFSEGQKRTMLENAVHSISDLRQVQTQASHDKVRTGKAITFDQYMPLLLSASMVYDSSLGDSKPPKTRGQRQVYSHDIDIDTRNQRHVYSHDIDTDVSYGDPPTPDAFNDWEEVYNASYDRGPRLSKSQWERLSEDARKRWDEFPPKTKHIILEAKSRPHPPARRTNLHDLTHSDLAGIDTFDFLQAHLHELFSRTTDVRHNGYHQARLHTRLRFYIF
jgi:hypothetical protein